METLSVVDNRIEVERSTFYDAFIGTREDLIAAGVATAAMFPEGRKRIKQNYGKDVPREWEYCTRYLKGGRYRITRQHEFRVEEQVEKWEPAVFRSSTARFAAKVFGVLMDTVKNGKTHRFTPVDQERIDRGFKDLLDVFARAEVVRPGADRTHLRPVK